uniref:Uncharacterized protein n=1 Tax=Heliothis virescens TaxID=7102 RepID=A0A2A4J820_HELVI
MQLGVLKVKLGDTTTPVVFPGVGQAPGEGATLPEESREKEDDEEAKCHEDTSPPPPQTKKKPVRYPPLVMERMPDWAAHFRVLRQRLGFPPRARPYQGGVRFTPESEEEYSVVQRYLTTLEAENGLSWFAYSLPAERSVKVAIRGLPADTEPQDILEELQELGHQPEYVRHIKARQGRPGCVFHAVLKRTPDFRTIYDVNILLNMRGVKLRRGAANADPPSATGARNLGTALISATDTNPEEAVLDGLTAEEDIDVALISETHLGPADRTRFPGYVVYRRDETSAQHHLYRDLAVLVKRRVVLQQLPYSSQDKTPSTPWVCRCTWLVSRRIQGGPAVPDHSGRREQPFMVRYSLPAERSVKVAIPAETDPQEILEELQGYQPEYVRHIKARKGAPAACSTQSSRQDFRSIYDTNILLNMRGVRIEAWRGKRGPAQCHRCQKFRHSSHHCHRLLACVRCGEEHRALDCPRPREAPLTCANCGGEHPACSVRCPTFIIEARNRRAGTMAITQPRLRTDAPLQEADAPSSLMAAANGPTRKDTHTAPKRRRRGYRGGKRGKKPQAAAAQRQPTATSDLAPVTAQAPARAAAATGKGKAAVAVAQESSINTLGVQVHVAGEDVGLYACYKPPATRLNLAELRALLPPPAAAVLIAGDLNWRPRRGDNPRYRKPAGGDRSPPPAPPTEGAHCQEEAPTQAVASNTMPDGEGRRKPSRGGNQGRAAHAQQRELRGASRRCRRPEIFAAHLERQFRPNDAADEEHVAAVEQHLENYFAPPIAPDEDPIYFSPCAVRRAILRTKVKKAPGADGITNTALRHLPHRTVAALARLYTGILRTGTFPGSWKEGRVIMLPKAQKNVLKPESYRPITLLPTISKVFEKLLLRHLIPHVTPRPEQFGFRAEHSTTLQLSRVLHHLANTANRKEYAVAVFLNMEKAFDRDVPTGWWLSARSQARARWARECRREAASRPSATHGTPTDGIPSTEDSTLALYADDAAYITTSLSARHAIVKMQRVLDLLPAWLSKWRLSVNVAWYALTSEGSRKLLQAQQSVALRLVTQAPRYVRNDVIQRDLKIESLDGFLRRLSEGMFARADASAWFHIKHLCTRLASV